MRKTKIVCTIGPASSSDKKLEQLMRAGMNVARLNFSHGSYASHRKVIRTIRALERTLKKSVAILQDLPGPKIRLGAVAKDRVRLQNRRPFVLTTKQVLGSELVVSVNFAGLTQAVKKGDPILLGDGEIELEAEHVGAEDVRCKIVVGGILGSHKGIHFPKSSLDIHALTPEDKKHLAFGIANKVDLVALSFVRTGEDILYARREMHKLGGKIPLIAKIEKHEALDHLDAILESVDGLMVARGDLALEIAQERIPIVQKDMIRRANHVGKPVITATQMLRSMVWNPRPTRAEITDVANAVLDGTDALMLSEETAAGDYPVEAVTVMSEVAVETEQVLEPRRRFENLPKTIPEAISLGAISLARDLQVKAFLIPTTSGITARLIARYRPTQPIIAVSPDPHTVKMLCLVWGTHSIPVRGFKSTDEMVRMLQDKALASGMVKRGDLVAITAGLPLHVTGSTNMITVKTIE